MSDPLSDWLRLREPVDAAARSEALTRTIADVMPEGAVHVLDLATGAGSNIRYLADRLPGRQRWLAVDRSAALLAELRERMGLWVAERAELEIEVETRQMDLGTLSDHAIFEGRHLVTASALLDLASDGWLQALAAHCRAEGAAALFTITYNGYSSCDPGEPEDEMVRALFNQHQKTDKRLGGAAAGPEAAALAERHFAAAGYQVRRAPSNWSLGPGESGVQRLLVDGWAHAATEMAPEHAATIAAWRARRLAHVDAGRSRLVVGHDDFAAWLPGT